MRFVEDISSAFANQSRVDGLLRELRTRLHRYIEFDLLRVLVIHPVDGSGMLYSFPTRQLLPNVAWEMDERISATVGPYAETSLTVGELPIVEALMLRPARPGTTMGWIESRRNWDVWGTGKADPFLGNAIPPANWDGPFLISPHNPSTVYAGTNELWRTTDRGQSWESLGDLTTGIERSELSIMGQEPTSTTTSLDDGIPFYPTLTAIAESPLVEGLLYAGTDDGNVAVSHDAGSSWEPLALPGIGSRGRR